MGESRSTLVCGQIPGRERPEFAEFLHYESGDAERAARAHAPDAEEPWIKVREDFEPGPPFALSALESDSALRSRLRGRILDVGAGTCWLAAWASRFEDVEQVLAVDLSESFLSTVGERVYRKMGGVPGKLGLVASDFSEMPLDDEVADAAFLCAALHHSLAPIRTLFEVKRCLKAGGTLFVIEGPASMIGIRRAREAALQISGEVSEVAYSRGELEYLFRIAGFLVVDRKPSGPLSPRWARRLLRLVLRKLDLEHVVLNPPTYLYTLEKG